MFWIDRKNRPLLCNESLHLDSSVSVIPNVGFRLARLQAACAFIPRKRVVFHGNIAFVREVSSMQPHSYFRGHTFFLNFVSPRGTESAPILGAFPYTLFICWACLGCELA